MRHRRIPFARPARDDDRTTHRAAKGAHDDSPPASGPQLYEHPNVVQRCFDRIRQFRYLATCCAKRTAYYHDELTLAAIILRLR